MNAVAFRLPRGGFGVLRASLPLAAVVIEFCWLYPWVLLLTGASYGPTPTPLLHAWLAFALLALGHLTVRTALAQPWPLRTARVVVVTTGFVAGLAAVKLTYYPGYPVFDLRWLLVLLRAAHDALPVVVPAVIGALTASALWWRGVVLGEREFSHFEIDRTFRRGVAGSVGFVLLFALYGDTRGFSLAQPAPAYLLAFFSLSLVTLAVSRLIGIWQESQADDDQALAMNRHWLLLLLGVVGLIFLAATVISGTIDMDLRLPLLRLLRPLAPVVEFVFYVVFSIAVVVARVILYALSRVPFRPGAIRTPSVAPPSLSDFFKDLPQHVISGARWGMVFLVVVLLLVSVAIAVVRARRQAHKKDEDERESVWSTEAVLAGLGAAWRSLRSRRRPPPRAQELPAVSAIRAIYRKLLRLGVALGVPRLIHQTPYEYRARLSARFPDSEGDLAVLTDAYVRVRYAPHTPMQEEIDEAQAALERVRSNAQRDS